MSVSETPIALPDPGRVILDMLKSQDDRIHRLEHSEPKSVIKKISDNASLSALFLGLVLSVFSLYDVFFIKPETARINAISQFNEAVNSAAKMHQEMLKVQLDPMANPQSKLAFASMATPQILNDIATARAILHDLRDGDVGIPQLLILISEAFTSAELDSAKEFVDRAVKKKDVSAYLRSEAKRYEGRYLFMIGQSAPGRSAFSEAVTLLVQSPQMDAARAYAREDSLLAEFVFGDCNAVTAGLVDLAKDIHSPGVTPDIKAQLVANVRGQLLQYQNSHCPIPPNLDEIIPAI